MAAKPEKPYRYEKPGEKTKSSRGETGEMVCCDRPMVPVSGLSMEHQEDVLEPGETYECTVCGLRRTKP